VGEVVQFQDFYEARAHTPVKLRSDGLVPLQFGVGFNEIDLCQQKLAEYGITSIHSRELKHRLDSTLHFITVADALWINKKILENERLSEQVVRQRIDLMQMLENVDPWLMEGIWDSLTRTDRGEP
jgi:hypothetical protein